MIIVLSYIRCIDNMTKKCNISNLFSFVVDGAWGEWGNYSDCTEICGNGTRERKRQCNDPAPQGEGKDCVGSHLEQEACNTKPCPGKYLTHKSINQ